MNRLDFLMAVERKMIELLLWTVWYPSPFLLLNHLATWAPVEWPPAPCRTGRRRTVHHGRGRRRLCVAHRAQAVYRIDPLALSLELIE